MEKPTPISLLLNEPIASMTIMELLEKAVKKSDSEIDWMKKSLERDKARAKDREEDVEDDAMYRFTDGLLHKEIAYNDIFKVTLSVLNKVMERNENDSDEEDETAE